MLRVDMMMQSSQQEASSCSARKDGAMCCWLGGCGWVGAPGVVCVGWCVCVVVVVVVVCVCVSGWGTAGAGRCITFWMYWLNRLRRAW